MSVTVVCTSFNRPDLLDRTLHSFYSYNTCPIEALIVIEDSGLIGCNSHLKLKYPNVTFIYNESRLGQIKSIDRAYAMVNTDYVFHLEEDWEFYRRGFIEDSIKVLNDNTTTEVVWIRFERDTNGHQFHQQAKQANGVMYSIMKYDNKGWHGFTFNPSLRKLATWKAHGGYQMISTFEPKRPWESEQQISEYYKMKGYTAAIIRGNGYVRHIGNHRGIRE